MAIRPLSKHKERLRFSGESDEALIERLKSGNRGAPQKPDESEAQFLDRLVRNAFMRVYMTESVAGKKTLKKRLETMKLVRGTDHPMAQNERDRHVRKRLGKMARLNELKSKPCMDCGGTFPPCAMQFDHRDPSTKDRRFMSPSNFAYGATWEKFEAEIAKCDLVCANCHAIRTHITNKRPHPRKYKPQQS